MILLVPLMCVGMFAVGFMSGRRRWLWFLPFVFIVPFLGSYLAGAFGYFCALVLVFLTAWALA